MKYDAELGNVRTILASSQNILIALSANPSVDELAAGLALYLSLKQAAKEATIVTEGTLLVGHTNLFGVGKIQNKLPENSGGDFTIVLSGVAADGKVPSVRTMDYFTTGTDLNLVFRVLPGQKFEPTSITPKPVGGNFDLTFVLGSSSLQALGGIYNSKPEIFTNTHLVNISNTQDNSRFGLTNIVDTSSAAISEIVAEILSTLQLPYETDIASNILSGIFAVSDDLRGSNVGADTYTVVADALRRGGQKPVTSSVPSSGQPSQPTPQPFNMGAAAPASQPPVGFDLSKIFNAPVNPIPDGTGQASQPVSDNFTVPPVVSSEPFPGAVSSGVEQSSYANATEDKKAEIPQPSAEETPMGEGVESLSPEADWLTPKIFRGKGG